VNGGSAERVDVVIPVKYGLEYLPQALVSVAAQGVAIDVVVVDDGAGPTLSDVVADAVREFPAGHRTTVQIVANRRRPGIGGARNTGVGFGDAPLGAFLDADDVWPARRTSVLADVLGDLGGSGMAFGMVEQFVDGTVGTDDLPEPPRPGMLAGGMLITRATWDAVGEFDEDLPLGEFIDWVARARAAGVTEAVADELVLRRRIHGDNTTLHRRDDRQAYADLVRRHLRRRP
jgi:glycosyltransferase involved in cell wall biosynthesis